MSVMRGGGVAEAGGGVVRCGYLKKLKTSRKKWFVLRAETAEASARLEYYDTERKYASGQPPKRCIPLKNCFNINRRTDTKLKHVIALYTKDDCFCMLVESDEDADSWLKALLKLQHGEEVVDGETPKPTFEHIWQVTVLNRGLGTNAGLAGTYRLCLTDKTLSLIKRDCDVPQVELNLSNIRSCGALKDFFFLEIGRSSTLGAGELWMETEDSNIANNVNSTVYHAMKSSRNKEELGPKSRNRSSSATESSKPTLNRKIYNMPPKCHLPQDWHHESAGSSQHPIVSGVTSLYQHLIQRGGASKAAERRHSISAGISHCGQISHQRTQSLPLAAPLSDQITTHPLRVANKRSNQSKCTGRERCDSMPSRPRTTSEGTTMWHQPAPRPYRPQSVYARDISHSPPSGSPVSPPSCSTDSAGSSYSLADEADDVDAPRYNHARTPDEAIVEEDCPHSPTDDGYVDMSPRGGASLSSVTSGTPSTDMKFVEYHLEKVTSYLHQDDDDDETRPARAYSVGSKPEGYKMNGDNLRVRALSVGSKKGAPVRARVLPVHGHVHGSKSSSAPILSQQRGQGSHGSIGPMDDLMEMDFSRSGSINNDYLDMRPGSTPKNDGYMEMKPARPPKDPSPYVNMSQGSSPARSFDSPYMEMDPRKNNNNNHMANNNNSDYLAMSFKPNSPRTEPNTPEGYVEMSVGRGHHHMRQSSLDEKRKKKRSQPIAIQNPGSVSPRHATPPTHLPLGLCHHQCSSVTTPTIFPFSPVEGGSGGGGSEDYVAYAPGSFPISERGQYEVLRRAESRPDSVNSDRVRPGASELHYARLDLESGDRSPRGVGDVTLTYAHIDFVKSEGLKHNAAALPNAKIKH